MFDVRERDAWRVVPWLVGQSNTGNSTLLDFVVKKFYQLQNVGILECVPCFLKNALSRRFQVCPQLYRSNSGFICHNMKQFKASPAELLIAFPSNLVQL